MKDKVKLCLIILVAVLIGMAIGADIAINIMINKMAYIIPKFFNISIDEQTIHDAMFRYYNNVGNL